MIKVTSRGFDTAQLSVKSFLSDMIADVDSELKASTEFIIAKAMADNSLSEYADLGIKNMYSKNDTSGKLNPVYTIVWDSKIAAYYEFGTGEYASNYVPLMEDWWRSYAKTFYVNGTGTMPTHASLYPVWETEVDRLIIKLSKKYA